jgi:1-acyl-sn-glycerol-3-phosphate acyltransferase
MTATACGRRCVGRDDVVRHVGRIRYVWRLTALAAVLLLTPLLGRLAALCGQRGAHRLLRLWARSLVTAAGISVRVRGNLPRSGPALLVSNHVTFFDGMALTAGFPGLLVVTNESAARNPLSGRLFRQAGLIFVDREAPRTAPRMVEEVTGALRGGRVVLVYPRGTFSCRPPGGAFPPAVLQAALDAQAPVRPLLTRCVARGSGPTARGSYFPDDESLVAMFRRVLRIRDLEIEISVLEAVDPSVCADRRALARLAKARIDEAAGTGPAPCGTGGG